MPPLPEVAEAVAFADASEAVVVCVRIGHTRRDKLAELRDLLGRRGVVPLGFFVTSRRGTGRSDKQAYEGYPGELPLIPGDYLLSPEDAAAVCRELLIQPCRAKLVRGLTPDFTASSAVIAAAAGRGSRCSRPSRSTPRSTRCSRSSRPAFVALAMSRLALAVAAFIVLTFPEHLPGSFGAGATLAKPVGALLVLAWGATVLTRRVTLPMLPQVSAAVVLADRGASCSSRCVSMLWAADSSQTRTGVERILAECCASRRRLTRRLRRARASERSFTASWLGAWSRRSTASSTAIHTRLDGIFDPNYFAAELIPAIIIACFLFVTARSRRARWLYAAVAGIDLVGFRPHPVARGNRRPGGRSARGGRGGRPCAGRASSRSFWRSLPQSGLGYYFGYKPAHVFQSAQSRWAELARRLGDSTCGEWRSVVFEGHPVGGVGPRQLPNGRALVRNADLEPDHRPPDRHSSSWWCTTPIFRWQLTSGSSAWVCFSPCSRFRLRLAGRALRRLDLENDELEFHVRGLLAGTIGLLTAYAFLSGEFEKPLWLLLALLASAPTVLREDGAEKARSYLPGG